MDENGILDYRTIARADQLVARRGYNMVVPLKSFRAFTPNIFMLLALVYFNVRAMRKP